MRGFVSTYDLRENKKVTTHVFINNAVKKPMTYEPTRAFSHALAQQVLPFLGAL